MFRSSTRRRSSARPSGPVSRAQGDVHPLGNPHYWLDPDNGKVIARDVAAAFARLRPNDKAVFDQRLNDFIGKVTQGESRWTAAMAPFKGTKVVTYHRSFPNFADRFGLDIIGYVEPRPGIPPSPQHTLDVITEMKRQNVKVVLVEPYFDLRTPNSIGYDLYYARDNVQPDGGRHVVLATNRRVNFREAVNNQRSMDYQFTAIELDIDRFADEVRTDTHLPKVEMFALGG